MAFVTTERRAWGPFRELGSTLSRCHERPLLLPRESAAWSVGQVSGGPGEAVAPGHPGRGPAQSLRLRATPSTNGLLSQFRFRPRGVQVALMSWEEEITWKRVEVAPRPARPPACRTYCGGGSVGHWSWVMCCWREAPPPPPFPGTVFTAVMKFRLSRRLQTKPPVCL